MRFNITCRWCCKILNDCMCASGVGVFYELLGRSCAARTEFTDEFGDYTRGVLARLERAGLSVFSFWNMQNVARQFYRASGGGVADVGGSLSGVL